MIIAYLQVSNS